MENDTQSCLGKTEGDLVNTIDDDRGSEFTKGVVKVVPVPTANGEVAKQITNTDTNKPNKMNESGSEELSNTTSIPKEEEEDTHSESKHNIINVKSKSSTSLNKESNSVVIADEKSTEKSAESQEKITEHENSENDASEKISAKTEDNVPNNNKPEDDTNQVVTESNQKMDPESDTKSGIDSNTTNEAEKQKSEGKATPGNLTIDTDENKAAVFYIGDEQNAALSPKSPRPTIFGSFRRSRDSHLANGTTENRRPSLLQAVLTKTKKSEKPPPEMPPVEFVPPDGGYGWLVVLAACVVNMWIVGFIKSYSVLYVQIIAAFPGSSAYHASWIPALLSTIGLLVAPLTGVLCREFTSRKVSAFGGCLCFLGLFTSAFATSLTQLIFTIGVITGLGAGLTQTPGILIVSLYFSKRRSLASAICVSGNAIGSFFMPPLIDYLVSQYRLRGTLLIVSALQLHIVAASLLYRPIRVHAQVQAKERAKLAAQGGYDKTLQNGEGGFDFNAESKFSRNTSGSIFNRVLSSKILAGEESEMTRQVSFLRSTSMMTSVPDLGQYAKSWSVSTANLHTLSVQQQLQQQAALRRRSTRKHTVSESGDCRPLTGSVPEVPTGGIPKNNSAITPIGPSHLNSSMRRVNSSQARMALVRQVSNQRQQSVNLSSLPEKELDSSCSLVPSEAPIREEDEDILDDILAVQAERDGTQQGEESKRLIDPIQTLTKRVEDEDKRKNMGSADTLLLPRDEDDQHDVELTEQSKEEKVPNPKWVKIKQAMSSCFDVEVLRTRKMILMSVSISLVAMGAPHSLFYLHAYAKSVNIDLNSVTTLLSISSMVDLFGRLGVGFIADMNIVNTAYIYFFSAGLAGVAAFCLTWTHSFWGMAVLLGMYGFGIGSWFVLMPTMLAHDHGIAKLAASFGFVRFCMGCINFVSPQISGVLVDVSGSYSAVYYFMGSCMFLAALLVLLGQWMPLEEKTTKNKDDPLV